MFRIRDPGSGALICSLNGKIHVDPNLLMGLLLPPHHIQVHALLLLLVALVHVHVALVPLVVWIPDVVVIIVIIVLIILQLVRNLGGGEPLGVSLSCPETKKYF